MSPDQPPVAPEKSYFALEAIAGFVFTPFTLAMCAFAQSPVPALFILGALVVMLFFRSTRGFGLGGLLFIGVALLALLAICGNSRF
jgi:hypothetical protein